MNKKPEDEILFDMLSVENEAAKAYSFALIGCTSPDVHDKMLDILCDQYQICLDIKDELTKRGFISPESVDKEEMQSVKTKFKS